LNDGREVNPELLPEYERETIETMLVTSISEATKAFMRGFSAGGIYRFRSSGAAFIHEQVRGDVGVDWAEMKATSELRGYSVGDVPLVLFWRVFEDLPEDHKVQLLFFISGSELPPASGFLGNPIKIQRTDWRGVGRGPIPTASTCYRSLTLPAITDESEMRRVIRICREARHGFHRL
jgi:hypothetical protein